MGTEWDLEVGEMVVVLSRVVGLGPTEREQKEWMRLHGGERPA